jgi:hypothetical protein
MIKPERISTRAQSATSYKTTEGSPRDNSQPAVHQHTFDHISRVISQHNVTLRKISGLLRPIKQDLGVKYPSTHSKPCEYGKVYIGQTGSPVEPRMKTSAISDHTNRRSLRGKNTTTTSPRGSYTITPYSSPQNLGP